MGGYPYLLAQTEKSYELDKQQEHFILNPVVFPVMIRHLSRKKKMKKFPKHFWIRKILVCCSSQPEAKARPLCPGRLPSCWRWRR